MRRVGVGGARGRFLLFSTVIHLYFIYQMGQKGTLVPGGAPVSCPSALKNEQCDFQFDFQNETERGRNNSLYRLKLCLMTTTLLLHTTFLVRN